MTFLGIASLKQLDSTQHECWPKPKTYTTRPHRPKVVKGTNQNVFIVGSESFCTTNTNIKNIYIKKKTNSDRTFKNHWLSLLEHYAIVIVHCLLKTKTRLDQTCLPTIEDFGSKTNIGHETC